MIELTGYTSDDEPDVQALRVTARGNRHQTHAVLFADWLTVGVFSDSPATARLLQTGKVTVHFGTTTLFLSPEQASELADEIRKSVRQVRKAA